MAFVETSTWQAGGKQPLHAPAIALYLPAWLDVPFIRQLHWRRPAGMVLALLLHGVLVWLLLTRTGLGPGEENGEGSGSTLKMIVLGDSMAQEDDPEQSSASTAAPRSPQSAQQESALDVTSPSEIPAEWSVAKIRVAQVASVSSPKSSPAPSPSPATGTATGSGRTGGSAGGGDVYDPYAGASPMRRNEPNPPEAGGLAQANPSLADRFLSALGLGGSSSEAPPINQALLERVQRIVRRQFPAIRGSVELSARISPTGQVLDLLIQRETIGPDALALIRQELIGRALFQTRADVLETGTVDLPELRF